MAQSPYTVSRADGSGTANELLSDRLYGGMTGSGKSVTMGVDIRELLNTDMECKVIEISDFPESEDRKQMGADGWVCSPGKVVSKRTLMARVEDYDYTLLPTDYIGHQREEMIQVYLDAAAAVAEEIDVPTVVAVDAASPLLPEDWFKQLDRDANIWITSQLYPARTLDVWLETIEDGTVVLHSTPSEYRGQKGAEYLGATSTDISFLDELPTAAYSEVGKGNPVLVGRPGAWDHQRIHFDDS